MIATTLEQIETDYPNAPNRVVVPLSLFIPRHKYQFTRTSTQVSSNETTALRSSYTRATYSVGHALTEAA